MAKPDRKPDRNFEPEYDMADVAPDDAPQADYDQEAHVEYDLPADPEYDDTLQADYEPVPDPEYDDILAEPAELPVLEKPAPVLTAARGFAFEVGRPVRPLTQQQLHPVVWRGHLKERHPATGLVYRVPVYRLADGHWDCYREEELQVA